MLLLQLLYVLTLSTVAAQQWPYNLPAHQKYWPEHEHLIRRNLDVQQRLATQAPVGVKKMSHDPDEMFFLDYWQFDPAPEDSSDSANVAEEVAALQRRGLEDMANDDTVMNGYLPPILLHTDDQPSPFPAFRNLPRDVFDKRSFQCPTGTNSCASINRTDSCCSTSETCIIIKDTGLGDVGCCPNGQSCSGSVSSCNTAQGYTSCPGSSNGGCCIPNYSCNGIGCAANSTTTLVSTVTITVTPGDSTVISTSTPSVAPVTTTQVIVATQTLQTSSIAPSTSVVTVYTTIAPSTTTDVVTAQEVGTGMACSSGFQSCAASLGGGCCPADRACGSGGLCPPVTTVTTTESTTVASAAAPVRPTSNNGSSQTLTTSAAGSICPTGYYVCSAYYIGACCQIGRNCDTTNCPATGTETIVSNGATIEVPGIAVYTDTAGSVTADAATSAATITDAPASTTTAAAGGLFCATGWSSCGTDVGGGCCPTGYQCGVASCTDTAVNGPSKVAKVAPASKAVRVSEHTGWVMTGLAGLVVLGMVLL